MGDSEIEGTHSPVRRLTSLYYWWSIYSYDSSMIAELHQGILKSIADLVSCIVDGVRPEVLVFESARILYLRRFLCDEFIGDE